MSKSLDNVEKVRVSWGDDNDNSPGDGLLGADTLAGYTPNELPVSTPVQNELDSINTELNNRPVGTWTFDGTTLSITGVPSP